MKKIVFLICSFFSCVEQHTLEYQPSTLEGTWKSGEVNLILKDSLAFDFSFGAVSTFRVKRDTIFMKEISKKKTSYLPKYQIISLSDDTLKLRPLKAAPFSLVKNADFVSFISTNNDRILSDSMPFDSLEFSAGHCPNSCPVFVIMLSSEGNYHIKWEKNIQHESDYFAMLSNAEIRYIQSLIEDINLDSLNNNYLQGSVHSPVHTLIIYNKGKVYSFEIDSYDVQSPFQLKNIMTYLLNSYKFYDLEEKPI
ncbi:DUF6438 domain-containing protein [Tunicatimonas pelagia]|uniref:DUF6438 domain-containing protein n=1 Tax=Tunicatimonas pelagia TaxID=931531 RepID=UPI00266572A1|nr:DUF6438 domain-containing protein [Tunicatimonas pelagia]WKN43950.1 DUF6438 domain-containing protein [Tunicatimonas pelagia]